MPVHRATIEGLSGGGSDRALRAFMVFHAIRAALDAYVLLAPAGVTREVLEGELVALATRYLSARGSSAASPAPCVE